ncbi:uncharacterized protein [Hetaerina americana]|uniref:uncharacterized protein n=1 Tax=Hetaerina americana TaxID=62018 RepID=UPI003A7F1778
MLNSNLAKHYKPTGHLTIGERLFAYRGRFKFTRYIPSKPAKCGIKLSTGKSSARREKNVGERVAKDLVAPCKGSGGNITMEKPEIIEFYSWSKAGVDTTDKMLGRYTTKRSTRTWPLRVFLQ